MTQEDEKEDGPCPADLAATLPLDGMTRWLDLVAMLPRCTAVAGCRELAKYREHIGNGIDLYCCTGHVNFDGISHIDTLP